MGVPGFFSWLLKNYKKNKDIVTYDLPENVSIDNFYIDANCLFHPQCFKVIELLDDWKSVSKLETKMMKRICNYLDYIINVVSPKKKVMISVDGVAPMAKMSQQRKRRYRSIDDVIIKEQIKERHNKKIKKRWSNTVITPGTEFMERLNQVLIKYISKRKDIKIVYSSYHSAGEGEHKILDDIRKRPDSETHCIYGLDADLIFLAMASQKNNMYLLREVVKLGKVGKSIGDHYIHEDPVEDVQEEVNFISINTMKEAFYETLSDKIVDRFKYKKLKVKLSKQTNMINDFIFVCYFLGNDFLPHFPSIDINKGGLDVLLEAYIDIFTESQVNLINVTKNDVIIDTDFLQMFINFISKREDYYFKQILPKFKERSNNRKCFSTDPYDIEVWEMENLKNVKIDDPIKLGSDSSDLWKFRYYEHYLNCPTSQYSLVNNLCKNYLEGLIWVANYYFHGCPCWKWQYKYTHAPFVSDLSNYISKNKTKINDIKFKENYPLTPCQQLLAVLPPACSNLLPLKYRKIVHDDTSEIIDLFPLKFGLDMINKDANWKCVPMIPYVESSRIEKATSKLVLSKEEKIRNKTLESYEN
tara:strand:- start:15934 stop:17688 length:1755 start_codon:yes stop_codon:yes gene_type:complete